MLKHPSEKGIVINRSWGLNGSSLASHVSRLIFAVGLWAIVCVGIGTVAGATDTEAQQKVTQLLQKVIQDYWNNVEANYAGVTNQAGKETNVIAAFRLASQLMPDRLDLRLGLASSMMTQAIQTNGVELESKVKEALRVYQEVRSLDTNGFEAPILYAAYARAIGETNDSAAALDALMANHPTQTREYLEKFSEADRILGMPPQDKPARPMPQGKLHAIVILGAGLETNGEIKAKLVGRLKQGLKLARMYTGSPLILTGGNQKAGVTEAYVMSRWLAHRGVSRKRLILEDKAKDTVENALFSSAILQRLGVTHVTLVTSASHVRRGLVDLEEACRQRGLTPEFDPVAASAKGDTKLDPEQERVGVYRDLMRVSGLWAFPGIRR